MSDSPNDLAPRVAVLEQIAKDTREALNRIERRFDVVDARFDRTDARMDAGFRRLDERIDKLGAELRGEIAGVRGEIAGVRGEVTSVRSVQWTTFLWLLTLVLGAFSGLLGVMAKGFHWL